MSLPSLPAGGFPGENSPAETKSHPREPSPSASPSPWKHNPSKWSQRVAISLVASVAFVIATYMALFQWGLIGGVYDPIFGKQSEQVLTSDVSHALSRIFRLPDAAFGALAYLGDIIFALAGSTRRWQYRPWLVVIFGIDVIPLGIVSAVLVFLQGAVVGAWCAPCLVTAAISLILVVMAYDEVASSVLFLWRVHRRSGSWKETWDTLWGRPSRVAHSVGLEMTGRRSRRRK